MNIKLVPIHKQNLRNLSVRGKNIVEIYNEGSDSISVFLYDTGANKIYEVASDIKKTSLIAINNCIWKCRDFYFASCEKYSEIEAQVSIFAFDCGTKEVRRVLSFTEDIAIIDGRWKLKLFILSDTYIVSQTERIKTWDKENLMGNIEFRQKLFNTDKGDFTEIIDLNLRNNGINSIIPVSETKIMLKTGFSGLEDERIALGNESEALIESVYIGAVSQFITDVVTESGTMDFEPLGTAYNDICMISPVVKDNYVYFTTVNINEDYSDTFFYNFVTGETKKSHNTGTPDMYKAYVIDNKPFMSTDSGFGISFIDIDTAETECYFDDDEFTDILGKLFICKRKRGLSNYIQCYRLPRMNLLSEEKGSYVRGCISDEDYYIYYE